jgi:putative copper resistance protein D
MHFGSCLVIQSSFVVLFFVATPTSRQAGASPAFGHFCRLLWRLLLVCLLTALVSGFLWVWLAIAGMSGSDLSDALQPSLFSMVLFQTQPGHVWLVRAALAVLLVAALFLVPKTDSKWADISPASMFGAVAATLLTASLAWLGHAGASDGPDQKFQLSSDIVHLIAAGIWPAGLVPLAIFLRCFLKSGDPSSLLAACMATRRFSVLSIGAVAMLALSGVANSYYLLGSFRALLTTEYGRWLTLKLAFFAATVGIGAWNLFLCRSRLMLAGEPVTTDLEGAALGKVARNVLIEITLSTAIVLVVGQLGILPPAAHSLSIGP